MMVNLVADNDKLRARAARMVAQIAGVSPEMARNCLAQTNNAVKPADLVAAGAAPDRAERILIETKGYLRAALVRV